MPINRKKDSCLLSGGKGCSVNIGLTCRDFIHIYLQKFINQGVLMFAGKNLIPVLVAILALINISGSALAARDEAERLWELGEKAAEAGKHKEALAY